MPLLTQSASSISVPLASRLLAVVISPIPCRLCCQGSCPWSSSHSRDYLSLEFHSFLVLPTLSKLLTSPHQTYISTSNPSPQLYSGFHPNNSQMLVRSFMHAGNCSRLDSKVNKTWSSLKSRMPIFCWASPCGGHTSRLYCTNSVTPLPPRPAAAPVLR